MLCRFCVVTKYELVLRVTYCFEVHDKNDILKLMINVIFGWRIFMKYIYKSFFLIYLMAQTIMKNRVSYEDVYIILTILILNIIREKYLDSIFIILAEVIVIGFGAKTNSYFVMLYGITVFDLMGKKEYRLIPLIFIVGGYFLKGYEMANYIILMCVCSLFGYLYCSMEEKEKSFKRLYDDERRNRYELETTKEKLLISSRDIAHLAEVNERNRIAREIHDTIGHSIAGILMQLQAAYKLKDKDINKSYLFIEKSIEGLSNSLTILRNTVYNIRPKEKLGIGYINTVIDNFKFCDIDFKYTGDFNNVPVNLIEIIATNIKESLTNASKHSDASKIDINLDINDKYIRLYIKDNGKGCQYIKEGIGISGMKDRIKNIGGSISISSQEGFLIVCILPIRGECEKFEDINS